MFVSVQNEYLYCNTLICNSFLRNYSSDLIHTKIPHGDHCTNIFNENLI